MGRDEEGLRLPPQHRKRGRIKGDIGREGGRWGDMGWIGRYGAG